MKITIETEYEKYVTEFTNIDVSLEQIFNAIKGMLVATTWNEQTINNYIAEWAELLKPDNIDEPEP